MNGPVNRLWFEANLCLLWSRKVWVLELELKNLCCGYGGRAILRDVSLSVGMGEVLCVLGPNGTGKTTLFKTILGLIDSLGGDLCIEGQSMKYWSRQRMARIMAYIPQAHNPPFPFKVLDVVTMGRTAHLGSFSSPAARDVEIARRAMVTLKISYLEDRVYTEISGGEKQLVLIARALAQEPRILVMDEPTSALDFGNQLKVLSHVRHLADRGLTIIMATHFPDQAFLYAHKVILLKGGVVYGMGDPNRTITEEALAELYGVDVRILNTGILSSFGQREIKVCLPREQRPEVRGQGPEAGVNV